MIYPSPDKLDALGSKYALVIVAAKRARQIREGARRLVTSKSANPLTIALEELAEGEVISYQNGPPEVLPTTAPIGPVLSGLVSTAIDDDDSGERGRLDGAMDLLPLVDDDEDHEADLETVLSGGLGDSDDEGRFGDIAHLGSDDSGSALGLDSSDDDDNEDESGGDDA